MTLRTRSDNLFMPAIQSLTPAEWHRIKAIDAAYGQASRFYGAAGISRGAFKSLAANGKGLAVTLAKVRDAFEKMDADKKVTPEKIVELVAEEWGIALEDLRRGKKAEARHAAAYLLEKETGLKNNDIAALLGYADHTGVLVAMKAIGDRMDTERALRHRVMDLRSRIQNP